MFIGLLLLGTLGFVFDRLFVLLTQRLFPWYTTVN
jgi:ABC-type nitrate/sulfonate/bicarbonate transport system permease component